MNRASVLRRLAGVKARLQAPATLQGPLSAVDVFARSVGAPDGWQAEILTSTAPRVWVAASRQSGKSQTCGALATAEMLAAPGRTVVIVAPTQDQAAELLYRVRSCYNGIGRPLGATSDSALRLALSNGSRCIALPGTERSIRGYSPSLVLIDEAALVADELYYASRPLLAATKGRLIAVSSVKWAAGWWYEAGQSEEGWEKYTIPADKVTRITPDFLEGERLALPEAVYLSEYYCVPMAESGNLFSAEMVRSAFDSSIEPLW